MGVISEIKKEILERAELDINEKMMLVAVLCTGGAESLDRLAEYMGTTVNTADMAFKSLRSKGYFSEQEPPEDEEVEKLRKILKRDEPKGGVIKKENILIEDSESNIPNTDSKSKDKVRKLEFEAFEPEKTEFMSSAKKSSTTSNINSHEVDKIMQLLDEHITRSEATILLGFAGGDFEKIESAYSKIRGTQIDDKVTMLANMLQSEALGTGSKYQYKANSQSAIDTYKQLNKKRK